MPTPCWLKHLCSIRALVPVSVCLSFSFFSFLSFFLPFLHFFLSFLSFLFLSFSLLSLFLSFFLSNPSLFSSLFLANSLDLWGRWAHFLAWASKTLSRRHIVPSLTREGAWYPRAAAWALRTGLLAFCVSQGISASFSLLLSEPPGSVH